jgi:RNA recognition motif-containing protein
MKIYVGKLNSGIAEEDLKILFQPFGHVTSVYIWNENENGENFSYGIIDMPVKKQAQFAIVSLDQMEFKGHILSVHVARMGSKNRRKAGRVGGRRHYDPPEKDEEK